MSVVGSLIKYFLVGRLASKTNLTEYPAKLETSGREILQRAQGATDTKQNRHQLNHIIGIERWGQSRLRVTLGELLKRDEYDEYRPFPNRSWGDLQNDFQQTRQETIALAKELIQRGIPPTQAVLHNSFGDLTIKEWLQYLNSHANMESKRLR